MTLLALVLLFCAGVFAQNKSVLGKWITVDAKSGKELSVVNIYKGENGKYYGQIVQMLIPGEEDDLCVNCKGADHNKPILGMIIIRDMVLKDGELSGGKVLDPDNGEFYHGKISVGEDGKLKLRGSIDKLGLLGRTEYWVRVKE